jgi:hypothetical protein
MIILGELLASAKKGEKESESKRSGDRRPETGDRRPETGDRRPETGDRRPETGDRSAEKGENESESKRSGEHSASMIVSGSGTFITHAK